MSWARAASMSFLTLGAVAPQRGRTPQFPFIISSTRSAVVLGSTVTGFSCGAGGAFTLAHSAMMSLAEAGSAANAMAASIAARQIVFARYDMVFSLGLGRNSRTAHPWGKTRGQASRPAGFRCAQAALHILDVTGNPPEHRPVPLRARCGGRCCLRELPANRWRGGDYLRGGAAKLAAAR